MKFSRCTCTCSVDYPGKKCNLEKYLEEFPGKSFRHLTLMSLFENDKLCLMKCPRGKKTACGFRILNSGII